MNNEFMRPTGTFTWKYLISRGADFGTFFFLFCTQLKLIHVKIWHKLWGSGVRYQLVVEKLFAATGQDLMYINQVKSADNLIKTCVVHSFHWVFMTELAPQLRSEKAWKSINTCPHTFFLKDVVPASQSSIASLWKNYCWGLQTITWQIIAAK